MEDKRSARSIVHFTKRQRLLLLGALFAGSGIYLGIQLDMMGAAGEHHAQIWDFIIALFGIAASITTAILQFTQRPQALTAETKEEKQIEARTPLFTPKVITTGTIVALLAFFVPVAISKYSFSHWQRENVTSATTIKNAARLGDGDTATIVLPKTKHQELAVTLKLTSLITSGSCESPAKLIITPTHNGNDEQPLEPVRSEQVAHIVLKSNASTQLLVAVDLSEEPSCLVKLNVVQAIYSK